MHRATSRVIYTVLTVLVSLILTLSCHIKTKHFLDDTSNILEICLGETRYYTLTESSQKLIVLGSNCSPPLNTSLTQTSTPILGAPILPEWSSSNPTCATVDPLFGRTTLLTIAPGAGFCYTEIIVKVGDSIGTIVLLLNNKPTPPSSKLEIREGQNFYLASTSVTNALSGCSGNTRTFEVTNTGSVTIKGLRAIPSPPLQAAGVTLNVQDQDLDPNSSTFVTITPGSSTVETPSFFGIFGDNIDPIIGSIIVLDYGSIYQGGYVYSLTCTPGEGVTSGRVFAEANASAAAVWSTQTGLVGANSQTDGSYNMTKIPKTSEFQAANACRSYTGWGYNDWYLPAFCELAYYAFACLNTDQTQSVQENLRASSSDPLYNLSGDFWSSTEWDTYSVKTEAYGLGGGEYPTTNLKIYQKEVRCSRHLIF